MIIMIVGGGYLSKKTKLRDRLLSKPRDFTFDEAAALLGQFGYYIERGVKTGGSRILFSNGDDYIRLHKPHPRNTLKPYQVLDIITALRERKLI